MTVIPISRRSKTLNDLLRLAQSHHLILQTTDGEQFVLARLPHETGVTPPTTMVAFDVGTSDDFAEEVAQTSDNVALLRFLVERDVHEAGAGNLSLEDVRKRFVDDA